MRKEERKALAAERKVQREALRDEYGHATVNGRRTELANYVVEPSGIFMGRGRHRLRGRWKEGAKHRDITINLSPDAPLPTEPWGEIGELRIRAGLHAGEAEFHPSAGTP